jgi:hypothetical protein
MSKPMKASEMLGETVHREALAILEAKGPMKTEYLAAALWKYTSTPDAFSYWLKQAETEGLIEYISKGRKGRWSLKCTDLQRQLPEEK